MILKDQDSIIIENPGSIITGKAQMLKGGMSEPRNSTIMKMFNLIHVGERAGSGVPNIFSIWNDEGLIPPEVEELYQPDRTILRLSFVSKTVDAEQNSAIEPQKSAIEPQKLAIEPQKLAIGTQNSAIEPQKSAIEKVKLMMQDLKYNEPTWNNIEKVYSSIKANQVFGSADIKAILNCSDSTARAIIAKLRDEVKAIVAVNGQGKAKYRFINETDN